MMTLFKEEGGSKEDFVTVPPRFRFYFDSVGRRKRRILARDLKAGSESL